MKNLNTPPLAIHLMDEVSAATEEDITVAQLEGFIVANFAGMVACRPSIPREDTWAALQFRDSFGNPQIVPKPIGSFLRGHIMPAVEKRRTPQIGSLSRAPRINAIDISRGQAAWLFLDGNLESHQLQKPTEVLKEWVTSSFHHGVSNSTLHTKRLGWKVVVDWGLNPLEQGGNDPFIDLNVLFAKRDNEAPTVHLG